MLALQPATQVAIAAVLVPALFIGTLAIGRWLKRRQGVRLSLPYFLFCAAVSLYVPLALFGPAIMPTKVAAKTTGTTVNAVQLQQIEQQLAELKETVRQTRSRVEGGSAAASETYSLSRGKVMRHLGAAIALLGVFVILALVRRYFWELWFERKLQTPAPKFLSQIFGLIFFVSTALVILSVVYNKDLGGFVFGSTVVVGIIGFAMQDLLGNIIAGVALEIGKPFKTGDWLVISEQHAEVIEVNWRSTRLRTNDDVYLDIPNKSIVGSTITNLSYPTKQHALRIKVGFDYNVPPNFVKACMVRAVASATGVLATPPPKVFLRDFAESALTYEIKFWIDNEAMFNDICDSIRTNVWYEAQRSKIRIPFPIRTLQVEKPKPRHEKTLEAARDMMRKQAFFQCLDEAQMSKLLLNAKLLRFGRHEKIIEQGHSGESMFVLLKGEADVLVRSDNRDSHVATLKTGDCFGEMSLLTGAARNATVVARIDCEMWELEKPVLAELLQENTQLVERLGELLAKRRMETEGIIAATTEKSEMAAKQKEYTAGILAKLSSFFEL